MKNNKFNEVNIFARIGKTPFSSNASEVLLTNLVNELKKRKFKTKLFVFYIFNFFSNWKSFFLNYSANNMKVNKVVLSSTSIKYIRDCIYFLHIILKIIGNRSSVSFFYNLNRGQLKMISFLKFLKLDINLIQADGHLLSKSQCKLFKKIIVFSKSSEVIYSSYKLNNQILFSLPYINNLNFEYKPFLNSSNNKTIKMVHCGSISQYNLPEEDLQRIFKLFKNNKNFELFFTTSQRNIPSYFRKLLHHFPSNIKFLGNLNSKDLDILLKKSDFALDLRNKNNNLQSSIDFPSKLFFYMKYNLFIFSTISDSIPSEISSVLIPFDKLFNLDKIKFSEYSKNHTIVKKYLNNYSLDKVLISSLEN